MDLTYPQLVEKYGEDNAQYLYDQLCDQTSHYSRLTFLRMGVEPDDGFEGRASARAEEKGLEFTVENGDLRLVRLLVNGPWNDDEFPTLPPGHRIAVHYGSGLIAAEKIAS